MKTETIYGKEYEECSKEEYLTSKKAILVVDENTNHRYYLPKDEVPQYKLEWTLDYDTEVGFNRTTILKKGTKIGIVKAIAAEDNTYVEVITKDNKRYKMLLSSLNLIAEFDWQ